MATYFSIVGPILHKVVDVVDYVTLDLNYRLNAIIIRGSRTNEHHHSVKTDKKLILHHSYSLLPFDILAT